MSLSFRRLGLLSLSSLVLMSFVTCGGDDSPSGGTPMPSPTANPGPTPTPVPSDPPLSASCERIGFGARAERCPREAPTFEDDVDQAIRTLQAERPDVFDGQRILKVGAYYVGLIEILDRQGICAGFDGEELGVKTSNDWNEQYDIETVNGLARFAPVSYRTTCYPAAFPIQPGPPIPAAAGCNLPPSQTIACGREPASQYYEAVNAAIGEVLEARPELFDYNDISSINAARDGLPGIRNLEAYASAVADVLVSNGYCARWDSKELQVKRGSNEFNEQHAITFSLTHVRRDVNMYRSSCYPSSF